MKAKTTALYVQLPLDFLQCVLDSSKKTCQRREPLAVNVLYVRTINHGRLTASWRSRWAAEILIRPGYWVLLYVSGSSCWYHLAISKLQYNLGSGPFSRRSNHSTCPSEAHEKLLCVWCNVSGSGSSWSLQISDENHIESTTIRLITHGFKFTMVLRFPSMRFQTLI